MVLEKTLESSLDSTEIQPLYSKGNQSWMLIGRTDNEAETSILWPPDVKNWLLWKDPDAGKDWRQEEKGMTEDEMVGWHHWLDGHAFEQALGVGDGQGNLACCSPRGHKEWLNWTDLICIGWSFTLYISKHIPSWCQCCWSKGIWSCKDLGNSSYLEYNADFVILKLWRSFRRSRSQNIASFMNKTDLMRKTGKQE